MLVKQNNASYAGNLWVRIAQMKKINKKPARKKTIENEVITAVVVMYLIISSIMVIVHFLNFSPT